MDDNVVKIELDAALMSLKAAYQAGADAMQKKCSDACWEVSRTYPVPGTHEEFLGFIACRACAEAVQDVKI